MVKLFGTTIQETINAFKPVKNDRIEIYGAGGGKTNNKEPDDKIKAYGRIVVTLILIYVAYELLKVEPKSQMAAGIIGAICGYWLK